MVNNFGLKWVMEICDYEFGGNWIFVLFIYLDCIFFRDV